jgi:hypothetical protein
MAKRLFQGSHEAEFGGRFSLCELVHRRDWRGSLAPHLSEAEWYYIGAVAPFEFPHIVDLPHNRENFNGKDRVERWNHVQRCQRARQGALNPKF